MNAAAAMKRARSPQPSRYEVEVRGEWVPVNEWVWRSWSGNRRLDGKPYVGPVHYLGSEFVVR